MTVEIEASRYGLADMARPKLPRPPRDLWIVRDRTVAALRPAGARTRTFLRLVVSVLATPSRRSGEEGQGWGHAKQITASPTEERR